MLRTILAGCDGFSRGRGAVAFASMLANVTGTRLLLVAAQPNLPLPFPAGLKEQRDPVDRVLGGLLDELAPSATAMVVGALLPAHALCQTAEREDADLIVVASRRRRAPGACSTPTTPCRSCTPRPRASPWCPRPGPSQRGWSA